MKRKVEGANMLKAVLVPVEVTEPLVEVEIPDGGGLLSRLQALVGGYIEIVRVALADATIDTTVAMVVNEEGAVEGLPRNERATAMYWLRTAGHGTIYGPAVMLGEAVGPEGAGFVDLPFGVDGVDTLIRAGVSR